MSETPDYRSTVFLPKTDFPMKAGLSQKEPAILARWAQSDLYGQLRKARAGRARFLLHDGPPYANGDIHMGHAMNKILKDIVVRAQSLTGKDAPYVPGWDCHGLPIEWKVEEQYRKQKLDKDEVPTAQFRAECRAYAEKWVKVQAEQFQRLGVQGEWDDPYLTMAHEAETTILAELFKFAEAGLLYRGAKPVMWSPVEKTALAEAEVEYEDITSTQIDVAFEIVDSPIEELKGAHAVVWTTTPWTIPVNQAIAYGEDVEYRLIEFKEPGEPARKVLIAGQLWPEFSDRTGAGSMREEPLDENVCFLRYGPTFKGSELAGTVARHPMHHLGGFFAKPRPFLPGAFVTTEQGTGLVHMAPDHGEDDFLLCKAHGIDPVFAVADDGRYRADWAWLGGQGSVINAKFNAPDGPICSDLRAAGALLAASADFEHSYPHSWRSKAKVIFRCTPQWFIPMDRSATSGLPGAGRSAEVGSQSEPGRGGSEALLGVPSPLAGEGREGGAAAEQPRAPLERTPTPSPPHKGEGLTNAPTLRATALAAVDETRWVPEKSRNRIRSMVEGRPDWVISRQRAWGVPIALYVNRKTGDYLFDPEVNERILAAFRERGADAWFTADHQALLGDGYDLADYEVVTDILDVWFDSGSTHAFVIEARYGEGVRADLYVEGSDQHRGWFQSSLLESSGTRRRAPYEAVLTHGFALDGQGRKMSKSSGNVVDPLAIIRDNGADILRLWVASTDYFEDVRIGKEVLAGTSDAYRKLRNTFRYLLGALSNFSEEERVAPSDMPELERWVLHRLAEIDAELKEAVEGFEFNRYTRLLASFANDDLSAFFFDIRKDSLYCDAATAPTRRAYRTVLDIVFHALVRWASPILVFTSEEVWESRFPDAGSVHLLDWPEIDSGWRDQGLWDRLFDVRIMRSWVNEALEGARRDKSIGSGLEADLVIRTGQKTFEMRASELDLTEIFITATAQVIYEEGRRGDEVSVSRTRRNKCGRCWRHRPEVPEDGALCGRCKEVVHG